LSQRSELVIDKLIVLGTGNAMVTRCYNTCFSLHNGEEYFLVDAGGGNGILAIIDKANIPYTKIHHLFVSHGHTDHVLGVVWVIRKIGSLIQQDKYEGTLHIYCHDQLVSTLQTIVSLTLGKKINQLIGSRIRFNTAADGEKRKIMTYDVTFFDIHSTKLKQFGFTAKLTNGSTITFTGDEPYNPLCQKYVINSDWLLSEAFCLYGERDVFNPYEKHHCTVKEACENATMLNIKNLVLWHTEDENIERRKELYSAEGKKYYQGNLFVPNDLDIIALF